MRTVSLALPITYTHFFVVVTLTPGPSVVGNEANRYIRRPMDQGSSLAKLSNILKLFLARAPAWNLTPGPSVVGNEANRYIRRPIDQGSSLSADHSDC